MSMHKLVESFSRLYVSNSRLMVSGSRLAQNQQSSGLLASPPTFQSQQLRHINKHGYLNEPGWKALGNRYLVKFPEDGKYTIRKLEVNKLAGRDPVTGESQLFDQFVFSAFLTIIFSFQGGLLLLPLEVVQRRSMPGWITNGMPQEMAHHL